ncbi:TonB-dependent receptor domain-containing protein [Rubrivirga sp.]|uniref:TonB-dependent receptor n=1 Tax=Rubrivirga sp. TaxID=1885344 RepID=UPI003B526E7C
MSFKTPRVLRDLGPARRLAALVVLLLPGLVAAQTGTLSGTVVDGDFGGGLPGASVLVVETGTGDATDIDGNYEVAGLEPGSYTVRYSFIGYGSQTVEDVTVAAGQTQTINITLTAGEQLEEVVVTAEEIIATNSEVGLLRVRAKAAQVSDAISAETISQSGASDAGDAMERVTGASVQGGRYVYVRGLGDRYANTQLNGSTLPTADPDRRAVQFDLFPSDFLENIVTLKTFTPDKPGSFSGGLVDINTRSFPLEFTASLSASTGLSTQVVPGDDILVDRAAGISYVGTADALDLPAALQGDVPFPTVSNSEVFNADSPEGQARLATIAENEALVDFFSARTAAPGTSSADPNVSLAASIGNRVSFLGNDLGFILGGTLDRGVGSYDEGVVGRYDTAGPDGAPRLRQRRRDQRSTVSSNLGGIANVAYRLGDRNEIGLNTLFSRSAESEARVISGLAPIPIGGVGDEITVTDRVIGHTERELASAQLRGRHQVPALAGLTAEWRANAATTRLDEPDLRFFANADLGDQLVVGGASLSNTLHFFRESTEDLGGLALDLTVPPRTLPLQIKVGGLYETTGREFRERRFEVFSEGLSLESEDAAGVDALFSPENSGVVRVTPPNPRDPQRRSTYVIGNRLVDNTQPFNQYDGTLDVVAGYGMVELPLGPLRVIAGARVEQTDLSIGTVDLATGEPVVTDDDALTGGIDEVDVLPSLNVVYALSERMNLRAAATRTLARPTFREIAPFQSFDFATDGPLVGNPALDRTLITNLDLRYEWFNAPGSIVAVSGYYKYLDRPIERVIVDIENNVNRFENVDEATLFGAEVEVRQQLGALGGAFASRFVRDFSVGGNVTVTRSRITIADAELAERRFINPDADDTRALQGQSPYLVNVDVSYDGADTNAGLYLNVFGRRLSRVGVPDVFEDPSPQLDFIASRRVFDQFKLKVSVKNLFGQGHREVYDFPSSTLAAIGGGDAVYQSYARGTSFSVGLSFSPRFGGGSPAAPAVPSPSSPTGL